MTIHYERCQHFNTIVTVIVACVKVEAHLNTQLAHIKNVQDLYQIQNVISLPFDI